MRGRWWQVQEVSLQGCTRVKGDIGLVCDDIRQFERADLVAPRKHERVYGRVRTRLLAMLLFRDLDEQASDAVALQSRQFGERRGPHRPKRRRAGVRG